MGWGRFTGQRDSEITDQLEDFIFEIIGDYSPMISFEERVKQSKELKKRAFNFISDQIHGLEQELEEKYKELDKELGTVKGELEDHKRENVAQACRIIELDSTIESREEEIEDLKLKLSDPTKWGSKKYGL